MRKLSKDDACAVVSPHHFLNFFYSVFFETSLRFRRGKEGW